ncbi:molybdopterin-dependent oxidoreductase [Desulfitobacterium sp. PCE1]|uniref:molybdopterin-dependent oxidoreductase n=1 Tax=Desulfitobacterium sp. PCE1 TaxID=146907 RepID=UPI00036885DE|nr:molybdopterin-dependent oxidoreductase [Desulfitobacterium sp. PCE1]
MAQEKSRLNPDLSRRTFLKASAATAATVSVVAANPWSSAMTALAEEENTDRATINDEQIFSGACRGNCAGGCFLNIHVRNGKVVRTSAREMPNPEYNRICVKGLTHVQRIYSKDRLKYPMKRAGERGEGKWEQITWDEAINTITEKWKRYQDQYGKYAFGVMWSSGSYATLSGAGIGSAMNRLQNANGALNITAAVDMARGQGTKPALGQGTFVTANEPADLKNSKTIFCWGANPVGAQQQSTHFFLEAKEKGAKIVVIDPNFNALAAKADIFVPVRPGSDAALALGMMNIVVRENWVDEPFLKKSSGAPFLVKESDGKFLHQSDLGITLAEGQKDQPIVWDALTNTYGAVNAVEDPALRGTYTINGIKVTTAYELLLTRIAEYPPEKAAEICNISVEQIEEITKLYATNKPSAIYEFFGIDHYVNGHYGYFAMAVLAILTGNLGKSGAFCGMGENLATDWINMAGTMFPNGAKPSLSVPVNMLTEVLETKMYGETPIDLKGIYFTHVNQVGNGAERKATLEVMKKLEFIVVADMNMNETAQYADILLPVAHWFEVDDVFVNYSTHPYAILQEKAIDPLYECKSDYEIYKLLADKLGCGDAFDMDEEGYMKLWMDTDGARKLGITLENLKKEKVLRALPGDPYIYAEGGVFATPSGRAQIYNESPAPNNNYGQTFDVTKEQLPYFEPPYEAWHENPLHEKYPFTMIQDKGRWRTHSQWWDVPILKELSPEPFVRINPSDAAARNIKTGDIVKLYNDRGYVKIKAVVDRGIQPGVLSLPKGREKHEFIEGHYQDLTSRVMNSVCANSAFFDVLVQVEKA